MTLVFRPTGVLASLRLRHRPRITLRHVLLTLVVLSTLYYADLSQNFRFSKHLLSWSAETPGIWTERAAHVKDAFRHAYHGYERHAFPHDELLPLTNGSIDK